MGNSLRRRLKLLEGFNRPEYFGHAIYRLSTQLNGATPDASTSEDQQAEQEQQQLLEQQRLEANRAKEQAEQKAREAAQRIRKRRVSVGETLPDTPI